MTDLLNILMAIKNDVEERYPSVRFEATPWPNGHAADIFLAKNSGTIPIYKHGLFFIIADGSIAITPGSLLRSHFYTDKLTYELADPNSIEKLLELIEKCQCDYQ